MTNTTRIPNHWELFESDPDYAAATAALDNAWEEAKRLAPELPSAKRALVAEGHVYEVMKKYRHVGACDTEPRTELMLLIRDHFGVQI